MKIKLISYWRHWWRRWSTWIISTIPVIEFARQQLPTVQGMIPPKVYQAVYVGLVVCAVLAMQVSQASLEAAKAASESAQQ